MKVAPCAYVWRDGRLAPHDDGSVHVLNQTLQYGWGVYEGIRAYATATGPSAFRLEDHLSRLERSAAMYGMTMPYDRATIAAAIGELILANDLPSCYIRPLVYAESGEMGIDPSHDAMKVVIATWTWDDFLGATTRRTGLQVCISPWQKISSRSLPGGGKACGAYLNAMLARADASRRGFDEAILLNERGAIADACVENVFAVLGDRLTTPPLSDGPLGGITRASVMELAADRGLEVQETSLTVDDLHSADEVFFTGTAAEVAAVIGVDGKPIATGAIGPVTRGLATAFEAAATGADPRWSHWLTPVSTLDTERTSTPRAPEEALR